MFRTFCTLESYPLPVDGPPVNLPPVPVNLLRVTAWPTRQSIVNRPDFRPHAFLIDLDGVLTDSYPLHLAAYETALEADDLGMTLGARELLLSGASRDRVLSEAGVPAHRHESVSQRKQAAFLKALDDGCLTPSQGAVGFLRELRRLACPTALVSNSGAAEASVVSLKLEWAFDLVIGGALLHEPKPSPEPFLLAAERLGVSPEECVAIEDSPSGAQAARAAGTFVVGVGSLVREAEVDVRVAALSEIPLDLWLGPTRSLAPD